jgi:hypothetical protein
MSARAVTGYIFTTPEHSADVVNLMLPVDVTVFTWGLDNQENRVCAAVAKSLDVVKLFKDHGLVMVIIEGNIQIRVAGAGAINDFLQAYFTHPRAPGIGLNLENLGQ